MPAGPPAGLAAVALCVAMAGVGVAATLAVRLNPPERVGSWGWCPWLVVTGRPCPTCGGLRALSALTHGDLPSAWAANGYLTATALSAVLVWLGSLVWLLTRRHGALRHGALSVAVLGWAVGLGVFGGVRWIVSPAWFIA